MVEEEGEHGGVTEERSETRGGGGGGMGEGEEAVQVEGEGYVPQDELGERVFGDTLVANILSI